MSDLTNSGYSIRCATIEIGCLDHYTSDTYASLKTIAPPAQAPLGETPCSLPLKLLFHAAITSFLAIIPNPG